MKPVRAGCHPDHLPPEDPNSGPVSLQCQGCAGRWLQILRGWECFPPRAAQGHLLGSMIHSLTPGREEKQSASASNEKDWGPQGACLLLRVLHILWTLEGRRKLCSGTIWKRWQEEGAHDFEPSLQGSHSAPQGMFAELWVHSFTQQLFLKYRLCVPGLCSKAWRSVPGRPLKSGDCWGQVHNQILKNKFCWIHSPEAWAPNLVWGWPGLEELSGDLCEPCKGWFSNFPARGATGRIKTECHVVTSAPSHRRAPSTPGCLLPSLLSPSTVPVLDSGSTGTVMPGCYPPWTSGIGVSSSWTNV